MSYRRSGVNDILWALYGLTVCAALTMQAERVCMRLGWEEVQWYLLAAAGIAAMFVCSMPDYALSVLLGDGPGSVRILDLTFEHRLFLYMAALIPIAAYFALSPPPVNMSFVGGNEPLSE